MRNETLKNLLLTASLISASAFLTACGDDAKDPAKSASQTDKIKKEEVDVLKTRGEAIQTLTKDQNAAGEEVKSTANQAAMDFANFDAQLPAKVEKASADAMVKAKMAYLEFEKNVLPKTIDALQKELTSIAFPMIDINQDQNITKLKSELDSLNEKLAKTPELSVNDQQAKLKALLVDRKNLKDTYLQEVIAYYSASNYGKEADIAKRDQIITEITNSFVASQKGLEVKILRQMLPNLKLASLLYNQNRQAHVDNINALKQRIDELTSFAGDQTKEGSLTKTLTGYFFDPSPKYYLTAMFQDNWDKYFVTVKDKLMSASMTRAEFADDLLDKFQTFIQIKDGKGRATLAEIAKARTQTAYQRLYKELKDALVDFFGHDYYNWRFFFNDAFPAAAAQAEAYSAETVRDISSNVSLRQARTAATGLVDGSAFKMNGVAGQSVELGMPLFIQLKGNVSSAKATEATTGSVAYRLGNTVIGAIQGYANSGTGFGTDSRQLETSVVASQSFGSFFIEGQIGTVSATDVHFSDWKGMRSQLTLGLDTEFVSPFVQVSNRQLNRGDAFDLNETTAYVGLDMNVAKLSADTYSIDTRLLAKAGYGSKDFSANAKALGSTTGFTGTVEWSASLNINSGVAFSSNLALDTTAGSSAGLTVSLDR